MSESADILASLGWDRVPSPCACCGEWGTDSTVNGWPVHARCWIGDNAAWLAALVIEEAAYWRSEVTGAVVNAEETLDAAEGRLLPGAQQSACCAVRVPRWRRRD